MSVDHETTRYSRSAKRLSLAYILIGLTIVAVKSVELYTGSAVGLLRYDFSYVGSTFGVVAGGLYIAAGLWLRRRTLDDLNMWMLFGPLFAILTASLATILHLP